MSDLLDEVQSELSALMVPWPDDYMEDLSPPGALFLLRQVAMATLKVVTGGVLSLEEDPEGDGGTLTEVMNGVLAALAGSTHACVALGVLPIEAEQAMETQIAPAPPPAPGTTRANGPVYS